jgi:hypothetical protein
MRIFRNLYLVMSAQLVACSVELPANDEAGTTTDPGESSTSSGAAESSESPTSHPSDESSESSEPSDTSESSGSDELVFIPPFDVIGCECDPFAQDCPEGEKCVPYASTGVTWDANKCVPVSGDGQPGEPCSSGGIVEATDSCGADSICWDGVCTAFCSGPADLPSCPDGTSCFVAGEGSIAICLPDCDPITQDCPEGLACVWANAGFSCVFTTPGPAAGAPCSQRECGVGLLCVEGPLVPGCRDSACCAPYCSLAAPSCPWPEAACVPFFESDPPPGYEDVGVCVSA